MTREYKGLVTFFNYHLRTGKSIESLLEELKEILLKSPAKEINEIFLNDEFFDYPELVNYFIDNISVAQLSDYEIRLVLNKMVLNATDKKVVLNERLYKALENTNLYFYDIPESIYKIYIKDMLNYCLANYTNPTKINQLLLYASTNGYEKVIINNFDNIIKRANLFKLNRIFNDDKNLFPYGAVVKNYINHNQDRYLNDLISDYFSSGYRTSYVERKSKKDDSKSFEQCLEEQDVIPFFTKLFKEIAQNENVKISDIKKLNNGFYSYAYKVGEKVVRLGFDRQTKEFPNNPYINVPSLRTEIKNIDDEKQCLVFVEVNEYLDKADATMEEMYQLYKKIREIGLIWTDVRPDNYGRLRKDNKIHWKTKLQPSDKAVRLKPYIGKDKLRKGELVVLDDDYIYDEAEYNEEAKSQLPGGGNLQPQFEERYQKEKNMEHQRNM